MTRIILNIEAGGNGKCPQCCPDKVISYKARCPIFREPLYGNDWLFDRLPACLAAEQEYKKFEALREAAEKIAIIYTDPSGEDSVALRQSIADMLPILAALKEGEK